jgi:hypothetical protein
MIDKPILAISKIHKKFSKYLKQPEALTDPEKYLGLNYQDVLNFWIYIDSLSEQKKNKMNKQCLALNDDVRESAGHGARNAAEEVVGLKFKTEAWYAAYSVTGRRVVFSYATWEIIGHHKILEQNKTPTFLPLCVKP